MRPIVLRGVRTRNLRNLDVSFEAGSLTSVVGVSGSGKTSLCFGTLHALSQQRFLAAMAPAARALIEDLPQPVLDAAEGLCPTLALEQGVERPARRTRAAELAGIELPLRSLFVACARSHSPVDGRELRSWTPADVVQDLLAAAPSAKLQVLFPAGGREAVHWSARGFTRALVGEEVLELETDPALPGEAWIVVDRLLAEGRYRSRLQEAVALSLSCGHGHMAVQVGSGEAPALRRYADHPWCPLSDRQAPRSSLSLFSPNTPLGACPVCKGTGEREEEPCGSCSGSGLGQAVDWYRLEGRTLRELLSSPFAEMLGWLERGSLLRTELEAVRQTAEELRQRLSCLVRLGTGYLEPGRRAPTLSLGELHRLRLVHLTGAALSGVCYVLDEPSTGLHPADAHRLDAHLRSLALQGNTVVAVDHRLRDLSCDRVLELGPGSGDEGGTLLFEGTLAQFDAADTPGARARRETLASIRPADRPLLRLDGARGRNLREASLEVVLGGITGVCGPSGAGKSSLVMETLVPALRERLGGRGGGLPFDRISGAESIEAVEVVDPSDESVSNPRSMVASLAGLLDPLRSLMAATAHAKAQGLGASRFSPNLKGGRCEPCQGLGRVHVDLPYLPASWTTCPHCRGTRFSPEILEVRWRGLNLGQILETTCAQALERFSVHPSLRSLLEPLVEAGLGYLPLGFPSSDLSGGELARLRLCAPLARKARPTLFVLDEPTRGLHPQDTRKLRALLGSLASRGHSVLAISHDPSFLATCDRLCEIGPGAATDGGRTLLCGRPDEVARAGTPTAASLARELGLVP